MGKASNIAISTHTSGMTSQGRNTGKTKRKPGSKFWDRIAKRYARSAISDEASYQKKLEITRQYFRPDMSVLEIGCGTGSTALLHAPFVSHILATDISENMLNIAKDKAEAQDIHNVTFEQLAVDELNQPSESFNAILGMSILHLLENKEAAIANAYRMLKPGGVFITSTACIADSQSFFKPLLVLGHCLGLVPLVKMFTTKDLVESIEQPGFIIDHLWTPGKGKAVFIVAKKPE